MAKKTKYIHMRVTSDLIKRFERAEKKTGMSRSEVIRRVWNMSESAFLEKFGA